VVKCSCKLPAIATLFFQQMASAAKAHAAVIWRALSVTFIYGRPVRANEFLDRETELLTIFNRLRNGESTAVVGEPHIGKSSMLLKLVDTVTQREYLGFDSQHNLVSVLDLHPVGNDYTPLAFWQEALEPLYEVDDSQLRQHLEGIAQSSDVRRPLERIFNYLGTKGIRLILMLDEFERLLSHPNFQDSSFFALLRSLTTRTGGLALVTATRLSVAQMNERGRGLLDTGSPFFNNVIDVRMRPFDERTVGIFFDRADGSLEQEDRRFLRRIAGRHPFLLQASTAALHETTGSDRHARATEQFYDWISFHFDDLWRTLDDRTRTTAVILSLVELGGRALGNDFAFGEIEKVDAFGPELRKLAERGLAEQAGEGWQFDWQHLLLWRGERWTIGAQSFAWWVRDVVIAGERNVPTYDEWLTNKQYKLMLTQEQWDLLITAVRNAPDWAMRGVAGLGRALFEELMARRR